MSSQETQRNLQLSIDPVQDMLAIYRKTLASEGEVVALSQIYIRLTSTPKITPERRLSVINPLFQEAIRRVGKVSLPALEIGEFAKSVYENEGLGEPTKATDKPAPMKTPPSK